MKAKMNKWSCWITETDPAALDDIFTGCLLEAGFKIVNQCEHYFTPYGYTKLWLLAESHLAVHTFPEENRTYVELSSCVDMQYSKFLTAFARSGVETFDVGEQK